MNWNSLLLIISFVFISACSNGLRFSKSEEGSKNTEPGTCLDSSEPSFGAPPALVEVGDVLSLDFAVEKTKWFIEKPDSSVDVLEGNSSYTVSQLGQHKGKLEAIDECNNVNVLYFNFEAFLPVGQSRIIINAGDAYTASQSVSLSLLSEGATQMYLTEDSSCQSGGTWQVYQSQKRYSLNSKNYDAKVYAKFKNPVGNESACVSDNIIHDDVNPDLSIDAKPLKASNDPNANFTLLASDNFSGIDTYFCQLDQGNITVCNNSPSYPNLNDGSHSFAVKVSDKAGNASDWQQYTWTVDTIKPSLQFTEVPNSPKKESLARFGFQGSDSGSGIATYECSINQAAFSACQSPLDLNVNDGSNELKVRARDLAGNLSDEISHVWLVDSLGPDIQITKAPSNPTNQVDAEFEFTVSDSGVGLGNVYCQINQEPKTICQSTALYQNLANGIYKFTVSAEDQLGNTAQASHDWEVDDNMQIQPIIIAPGAGSVDILFVMDSTASMYREYREYIQWQMQSFLSGLDTSDYRIGIITSDDRSGANPYRGGKLVPWENSSSQAFYMDSNNIDESRFLSTLARKEVTCIHGTFTGPNGSFCGASGWNLPKKTSLISSALMALDLSTNDSFFRNDANLNLVMFSDGNENCSDGMHEGNGLCKLQDTMHRAESIVDLVDNKWPGKNLKAHSIIWRDQDNCSFKNGQKKGHSYEYLSQITGGVSKSVCEVSDSVGGDISKAIKDSAVRSYTLNCEPVDLNSDGKIDANDIEATYSPDVNPKPDLIVNANKLRFNPAPPAGTNIELKYFCP